MIKLQNIIKKFPIGQRELVILQGIDLNIEKGSMVAIMGPSGSGKTTLLNILGCLDVPSSGSYILDGKEVSNLNRHELAKVRGQKIGFIFQTFNLLTHLTALGNVELGLKYGRIDDYNLAKEALQKVGLADRAKHRPVELSGGERQRVAIADEPTGNLDSKSGREIMRIIDSLNKDSGITLVIITHDPRISEYCNRTIHIMDGKIMKDEHR
jgi:putative ABC transport system ATP-binding protein